MCVIETLSPTLCKCMRLERYELSAICLLRNVCYVLKIRQYRFSLGISLHIEATMKFSISQVNCSAFGDCENCKKGQHIWLIRNMYIFVSSRHIQCCLSYTMFWRNFNKERLRLMLGQVTSAWNPSPWPWQRYRCGNHGENQLTLRI